MVPARLLLLLLLLLPGLVLAKSRRLDRLAPWARQTIELRRSIRGMQHEGRLRTAHPEVAANLSANLSKALNRLVRVPARRIIQVEWGSAEHRTLRQLLGSSVGVGIYPSRRWGHNKLRVGDLLADAVPGKSSPFPATGTRARIVPNGGMHRRFYEAVFLDSPQQVRSLEARARELVGQKKQTGMGCASMVSKLLREHVKDAEARGLRAFGGKLDELKRSETAAGPLWKKAAAAGPALIIVYTPPGDHRSISQPGFKFDYAL